MADSLHEFEEQLQQEALASTSEEVQFSADEYTIGGTLVRKDPDGTVYEFDPEKHAWFPKVPFRFRILLIVFADIGLSFLFLFITLLQTAVLKIPNLLYVKFCLNP